MRITERRIHDSDVPARVEQTRVASDSQVAAFEALLPLPGRRPTSLRHDLRRLSEPEQAEAALFSGSRPTEILEDIVERILPALDLDAETKTLAMALIREEIDTRQSLDRQRVDLEEG